VSKEKSKGLVGIFILITVLFFIFIIFSFFTISQLKKSTVELDHFNSGDEAEIAVIPIESEIMESKKIVEMLLSAEEDKKIKAIILRIDSPGGAVAPTQEIYEEVRRIDLKKPIYSSFGSVAASGGYYIAAATRKIYANAGTLTGSIGVIMQMPNFSELMKFAKVKQETIKAGKFKDVGNPTRDMTEDERLFLTDLLAGTHQQFMNDIVKVRGKRLKKDILELAQGQIFHGSQAKEFGLVDEVASLWQAGRLIHKELKLKSKFGLKFLKPKRKKLSFSDLLEEGEETMSFIRSKLESKATPAYRLDFN